MSKGYVVDKYSATGVMLWSHRWSGANVRALATHANGDIAATGALMATEDFGGGPLTSAGYDDVLLLVLKP